MSRASAISQLDDDAYERLLEPVWSFLAVEEEPTKSDVIFVFGGLDMAVPARAANLYHEGWAPTILVSGSAGKFTKDVFTEPEAAVFKKAMVEKGVPDSVVLTESRATNTQESVQFGMSALSNHGIVPTSALLVAKPFLMRRCIATFEKHYPHVRVRSCPPTGKITRFVDRERGDFAGRLVAELRRLRDYADRGFIVAHQVPSVVVAGAEAIEQMLR